MIEFKEHCSSVSRPGEGPRGGGGRRGLREPQEPAKMRGNPAVQKAVDFLFKSKCFVNFLVQIDQMAFQRGPVGSKTGPRGIPGGLEASMEPRRPF